MATASWTICCRAAPWRPTRLVLPSSNTCALLFRRGYSPLGWRSENSRESFCSKQLSHVSLRPPSRELRRNASSQRWLSLDGSSDSDKPLKCPREHCDGTLEPFTVLKGRFLCNQCQRFYQDHCAAAPSERGKGDDQTPVTPKGDKLPAKAAPVLEVKGTSQAEFLFLNEGRNGYNHKKTEKETHMHRLPPTAKQIKAYLDQHVIGQEQAKKILSVAAHNHYKRLSLMSYDKSGENLKKQPAFEKSNVILVGPTGTGKTLLASTLASFLDVPIIICDCSSLSEAGYVGGDVEGVVERLLRKADDDPRKAERGIIILDEVDKIAGVRSKAFRDISGEGVQQGFLKIVEGTILQLPLDEKRKVDVDTTNILFIAAGAFHGIEEFVAHRLHDRTLGFNPDKGKVSTPGQNAETKEDFATEETDQESEKAARHRKKVQQLDRMLLEVEGHDLLKYGLIPEFVGRFPIIAPVLSITEDMLQRVLTEPKNSILSQSKLRFRLNEVDLTFTEDAIRAIAKEAYQSTTGARGLRAIMERLLLDPQYLVPSDENIIRVEITEDVVKGNSEPVYIKVSSKDKPAGSNESQEEELVQN